MIVYVVVFGGGVDTVWALPEQALDVLEGVRRKNRGAEGKAAYVAVRPVGSTDRTPESERALVELRQMEIDRRAMRARAERARKLALISGEDLPF